MKTIKYLDLTFNSKKRFNFFVAFSFLFKKSNIFSTAEREYVWVGIELWSLKEEYLMRKMKMTRQTQLSWSKENSYSLWIISNIGTMQ